MSENFETNSVSSSPVELDSHETTLGIISDIAPYTTSTPKLEGMSSVILQRLVDTVESLPEYQAYMHLRVRFETMDSIVSRVSSAADQIGTDEARKVADQVARFVADIRKLTTQYYESILQMVQIRKQAFRLEDFEYRERNEAIENRRRSAHNALISTLTAYTRYCNTKVYEVLDVEVPHEEQFTREELTDREFIKEWAFNSEVGGRVYRILEAAQRSQKEKAEPV